METKNNPASKNLVNNAILRNIADSLQGIAFGTVTIKINNSRIVQIEVTENKRFDDVWSAESGSGI